MTRALSTRCKLLVRFACISVLAVVGIGPASAKSPPPRCSGDYVILLHGLGRSAWSMKRLEWSLRREGYQVVNVSYSSRRRTIEQLANDWLPRLLREQVPDPTARVHFVTHSLGGIIVRRFLEQDRETRVGRFVMLGPPNHGSEIVDRVQRNLVFRWFGGRAGRQLGVAKDAVPSKLGPIPCETGVIAGDRSFNPIFSAWLPGPDDGKVSVASTRVAGMKDHRIVHVSHTWLTWRKPAIREVSSFLRTGHFTASAPELARR